MKNLHNAFSELSDKNPELGPAIEIDELSHQRDNEAGHISNQPHLDICSKYGIPALIIDTSKKSQTLKSRIKGWLLNLIKNW